MFRQSREKAEQSKVLAANQGLYNGFLAAGLVWAVGAPARATWRCSSSAAWSSPALYGAATVNRRIFFVQALPALVAIAAVCLG